LLSHPFFPPYFPIMFSTMPSSLVPLQHFSFSHPSHLAGLFAILLSWRVLRIVHGLVTTIELQHHQKHKAIKDHVQKHVGTVNQKSTEHNKTVEEQKTRLTEICVCFNNDNGKETTASMRTCGLELVQMYEDAVANFKETYEHIKDLHEGQHGADHGGEVKSPVKVVSSVIGGIKKFKHLNSAKVPETEEKVHPSG